MEQGKPQDESPREPKKRRSGRPGRPKGSLRWPVAPPCTLTLAAVIDRSVATLGAQVLMLQAAGEKRGLDPSERMWLLDVHDRLAMLEGQRMRIVMAALVSDKLTPEQRAAILAELTGVRPAAIEAVEP